MTEKQRISNSVPLPSLARQAIVLSKSPGRTEDSFLKIRGKGILARMGQLVAVSLLGALFSLQSGCESCSKDPQPGRTLTAKEKERKANLQAAMADTGTGIDSETDTADLLPPPTTLITLNESAYGNTLAVDGSTVYLATTGSLWRFAPNTEPAQMELDLGHNPAFSDTSILYWSKGAIHAAPKEGGPSKKIIDVPHPPRHILASGPNFSWLDLSEGGSYTFFTLKKGKPRSCYRSINPITTPWMIGEYIYFIEYFSAENGDPAQKGWRVGRLATRDSVPPIFGPLHDARTPSMLGGNNDVYYFDLPGRSIIRVKDDLSREDSVNKDKVVCSPFSVSDRILCARVEGIFEVFRETGAIRVLTVKPYGLTVNIAASDRLVAWINETGDQQFTLRALLLNPPPH